MLLLSRNEAYRVRELIAIAPVTANIRSIPAEVRLSRGDGLPKPCVANLDTITTIPKRSLQTKIVSLPPDKLAAADATLHFAPGLE